MAVTVRAAGLLLLVLIAGCGGQTSDAAAPATTEAEPEPPLTYPLLTGPVPAWLEDVKPRAGLGRWQGALLSPDGETLLAQWTAECEIPFAYFVPLSTRKPKPVELADVESVAVAWNDDGRAGVFFMGGACGTGDAKPGLYLVGLDGEREFVTDDVDEVELWQAARR